VRLVDTSQMDREALSAAYIKAAVMPSVYGKFVFGQYSGRTGCSRAGRKTHELVPPGGKTAELPLVEQPCPSCTSVVDGLEGAAFHLAERINLVVIAKTSPDRLGAYAQERGWRNLRLLSSRNNTFNRDYHAEAPDGGQLPVLNVFSRDEDGIHHHWASEMTFKCGDTSSLDPVWAIYGVLDLTREGRGDSAAYPNLQY
jgi:predicted dithiol-disulfide oxidoreductase (DUF899 family)